MDNINITGCGIDRQRTLAIDEYTRDSALISHEDTFYFLYSSIYEYEEKRINIPIEEAKRLCRIMMRVLDIKETENDPIRKLTTS